MTKKIKVFIDSNIPMYAAGDEHPNRENSIQLLKLISEGKIFGITSVEILQEILYRYSLVNLLEKGLKIFDNFSHIIDEILPINFQIIKDAREILEKNSKRNIYSRDAVHVATMLYYGINYIGTFNKHFEIFRNIKYFNNAGNFYL